MKYMGTVTSKCGNKQYFISSEQTSMATGENLWSKCCAIGGVPAMFATTAEFECFVGLFSMLPWKVIKDLDYFVDGYDMNLTRQFVTCPNHRPILDELWLGPNKFGVNFQPEVFEPNNIGGGERCVALYIRPGKFLGLADKYCTSSFKYICQVTD
ncbi:hypothetical protein B566_EDAN015516 [Ephemera danica]|nr:hypothetical protein B566_EDAN015516 [Ephemera danica]